MSWKEKSYTLKGASILGIIGFLICLPIGIWMIYTDLSFISQAQANNEGGGMSGILLMLGALVIVGGTYLSIGIGSLIGWLYGKTKAK